MSTSPFRRWLLALLTLALLAAGCGGDSGGGDDALDIEEADDDLVEEAQAANDEQADVSECESLIHSDSGTTSSAEEEEQEEEAPSAVPASGRGSRGRGRGGAMGFAATFASDAATAHGSGARAAMHMEPSCSSLPRPCA